MLFARDPIVLGRTKILKRGAIYSILYTNWKTNPTKIWIFVFYAGRQKIHALNINARQLNSIEKIKLIFFIQKISNLKRISQINGYLLYRVFKKYLSSIIKKCYRTYKRQFIYKATLINYGLNTKEEFDLFLQRIKAKEKELYNTTLYNEANNNFLIKVLNSRINRKFIPAEEKFAKPIK